MAINTITLSGRLVADLDLRYTQKGIPVTHGRAHHTRCVDTCSNTATDLQRLANQSHMLMTHDVKHSAIHSDIRTQHQGKFH